MTKQALEEKLGITLKAYQTPNWAKFRGDHHPQSCLCDEAENVLGLILKELDDTFISLPALDELTYCCISDNPQLTAIEFEQALPALRYLDLSDNQLINFTINGDFPELDRIDISRNKLKKFIIKGALPVLNMLDLSGNPMKNVEVDMLAAIPQLAYLYLHKNPLNFSIGAYHDGGTNYLEAAKKLKAALDSGERVKNEEYKVLLVGDGKTGKSCVVNRLVNNAFNPEWDSTHGISVQQFKDTEKRYDFPYILNLWDFGGQDIYHTTHRLFMQNNTTYLLLWNEETEVQNEYSKRKEGRKLRKWLNRRYKYWLRYIAYIGKKSPLLIIQTKAAKGGNKHPHKQDITDRYDDYFEYLEFLSIDSEIPNPKESGYRKMMSRLTEAIEELEREEWLPKRWITIRDALRAKRPIAIAATKDEFLSLEDKFMSLAEYRQLATAAGETNPDQLLTNWLVKTGVVFYKKGLFDDKIILNQEWAIKAIYTLFDRGEDGFYHEIKEKNGRFSGQELRTYWEGYPLKVQELFLGFMLNSEMCFEVKSTQEYHHRRSFEERQFIAIELMSNKPPNSFEERASNWATSAIPIAHIRYQYPFLHQGIIQSFIARTHAFAEVSDMYKNGILLTVEATKAMIEADEAQDEISIKIPLGDKILLDRIRNEFENIQKRDENTVAELISLDGKVFVNIKDLLDAKDKKEARIKAECGTFVRVADFAVFLTKDEKETFENARKTKLEQTKLKSMEKVRALIANGKLDRALTLLGKHYNSTEITQLQERLSTLNRDKRMGVLTNSEATTERNKITASTLALLGELEKPAKKKEEKENPINPEPVQEEKLNSKTYISYAWGGDSSKIADLVEKELTEKGIVIHRDLGQVGYKDSIQGFMKEIGKGNRVILLISEKYLKSDNCMYELTQIYQNEDFKNRIFPIILADANIYKPIARLRYIKYWDEKIKELDAELKSIGTGVHLTEIQQELNNYADIRASFDKMAAILKDMNALNPEIHQNENFESLYQKLIEG